MIKRFFTFYFAFILGIPVQSDAQISKVDIKIPHSLKQFIPKGYQVLDRTMGDLNRDAFPDAIMVLYKEGEEKTSDMITHPEKRPLLILAGQANKTYQLAAKNNNVVYCVDCGGQMGDPFTGITIKNGYFSVEHYGGSGWRWTRIITFKYSAIDRAWLLHKDGSEHFHALSPEKGKTEVKTVKNFGKLTFEKFDIYRDH